MHAAVPAPEGYRGSVREGREPCGGAEPKLAVADPDPSRPRRFLSLLGGVTVTGPPDLLESGFLIFKVGR